MSITETNPVSVGDSTQKPHYDVVFDGMVALKQGRLLHSLGGRGSAVISDTSAVALVDFIDVEIDGTNLSGFTVEVHAMCSVVSGTGTLQLYNVTTAAVIASGSFTATSPTLTKITGITLTTGVNVYRARFYGSTAAAGPSVYGASLVLR
jgi:hypothetical protein